MAAILILTVLAAWPSMGLTHYAVAIYGGLFIAQGTLLGIMIGQLGETVIRPRNDGKAQSPPPYLEAVNDSHVKASIVAIVAAIFTLMAVIFCTIGIVRCYRDGFSNVSNLGDYVFGNPLCLSSLTPLIRRQPYLTPDLMNYGLCQDDLGLSISFAVIAFALVVVDVLVVAMHEAQALTDWTGSE